MLCDHPITSQGLEKIEWYQEGGENEGEVIPVTVFEGLIKFSHLFVVDVPMKYGGWVGPSRCAVQA